MTSSERRLHPLSLPCAIARRVPQVGLPILLAFVTTRAFDLLLLTLGAVVLIVSIPETIYHLRFRYSYGETGLIVRSGLFTVNVRTIPYARIQNLDATQTLVQRIFGVLTVQVQTGGGALPEATLRVIPVAALDEMRTRVHGAPGAAAPAAADADVAERVDPESEPLLELNVRELLAAGFIDSRGFVIVFSALALLEQAGILNRVIVRLAQQNDFVRAVAAQWLNREHLPILEAAAVVAGAIVLLLLFIRILSMLWTVVRLHDFRLARRGSDLMMQYGLLTRVTATIPLRRIQTVIIRETMLHRMSGRCSVSVVTAGGPVTDMGAQLREPVAPILPRARLQALLDELQPGLSTDAFAWQPVHPRAFGRMLRGALLWIVPVSAAAWPFIGPSAALLFVTLAALAVGYAHLRSRNLGWALADDVVAARDGALAHTIRVARYDRVQVVATSRGPLDLRLRMAALKADTAGFGGGVRIPFLDDDDAARLHGQLVERTEATPFTW